MYSCSKDEHQTSYTKRSCRSSENVWLLKNKPTVHYRLLLCLFMILHLPVILACVSVIKLIIAEVSIRTSLCDCCYFRHRVLSYFIGKSH